MSNFVDGSGPIFSMYLEMATEEDKKMAENWKADADGILIFTGLFSASVASLISVSIQDIRPNPQDTSNFYLANIYQTVADPNRPISLPASPPPFSPPNYAVWVNGLWFLSLVISITCALLATLPQQWARRYLKVTQPRYSTHKRARIRAFFFEGIEKFLLPWAVEALPTLLHVSLFLFFAGLSVFLCNIHLTIFKLVLSWIGVCVALYGCITFISIACLDSPYHTPLSLPAWHVVTGIPLIIFRVLLWLTGFHCFSFGSWRRFLHLKRSFHNFFAQGMQKTAEETALSSPSEIDTRAFMWTFDSLDEDHELERFFSNLPGFRNSKVVDDPLPGLTKEQKLKLSIASIDLLDLTFSSDLLPEPVKNRRAVICAKAIDSTDVPYAYWHIVNKISSEEQYKGLQTAEFGRIMKAWGDSGDRGTALVVRAIHTGIVARAQERDDSWFILASNELGVPESVLRDYAAHGNNLSFAILIHIVHQQLDHIEKWPWQVDALSEVLETASKFNVQDTSLDLQHKFCALWNQAVFRAEVDDDDKITWYILRNLRGVYTTLHLDTNSAPTQFSPFTNSEDMILQAPSSYPFCIVPNHCLPRTREVSPSLSASTLPSTSQASTSPPSPIAVQHTAHRRTPSDVSDIPLSPPTVVLDNMPPTIDPPLSSDSAVTRSDHTSSSPESHSSKLASPAPGPPPPRPISALDAAAEGEGSAGEDKDALDPSLAIHKDTMATPDLSPQSPSPSSVTDVVITATSRSSPDAEHTRDHLHPSLGQYDNV